MCRNSWKKDLRQSSIPLERPCSTVNSSLLLAFEPAKSWDGAEFYSPNIQNNPDSLPDGVRHFKYLPFSQVFPHAAALVHHDGIGTTAHAIAAGIPQIIRPMAHDQPDNSARITKLGIGVELAPKEFTGKSLAEKINTLLSSPDALERCQTFASEIDPAESLDAACEQIENFTHTQLAPLN